MSRANHSARPRLPLDDRDRTADDRDRTAREHDATAAARDARSEARDLRAEARETEQQRADPKAASDRAGAKRDRQGSAGDRQHAEDDRGSASTDRDHSARERAELLIDGLTGVHRREPGVLELAREVMRAHRTGESFVLTFVDVIGLKALNDSQGHAAGDRLLSHVVDTIRGVVRDYDLIVRYGGDEFLCGLVGVGLDEARRRFEVANASLDVTLGASLTAGFAELAPDESLEQLITRADAAMYAERHSTGSM